MSKGFFNLQELIHLSHQVAKHESIAPDDGIRNMDVVGIYNVFKDRLLLLVVFKRNIQQPEITPLYTLVTLPL